MLDQLALADFIARGELERHLRRIRLRYRERRDALVEALSRSLPEARVRGVAAGLFVLALLPDAVDEEALVSAAAARGVGVEALSWHRLLDDGAAGPRARLREPVARARSTAAWASCDGRSRWPCKNRAMDLGLGGRACAVTGASSGIGRATAVSLARERARCCSWAA